MGVGEAHPLRGKAIDIRRRNLPGRVQTPDVAVAQIVGQDIDDVGPFGGCGGRTSQSGPRPETTNRPTITATAPLADDPWDMRIPSAVWAAFSLMKAHATGPAPVGCLAMTLIIQTVLEGLGSVQHADDFDAFVFRPVEDDVFANHALRRFGANSSLGRPMPGISASARHFS